MNTNLKKCKLINFPKLSDPRGNLTFIESEYHIPFKLERVYYLYDIPGGSDRGGHAHKDLHQVVIAIAGSFDIHLDDGINSKTYHLNRSYVGLYICPMIWRKLDNFSSGAVCLVLASHRYEETDYFRNYEEFVSY
jgi:hypothetical protein